MRSSIKMKKCKKVLGMLGLVFPLVSLPNLLMASESSSLNDPLLKILIKKGVLTEEEALQIKKEAEKEAKKEKEEIIKTTTEKIQKEGLALPSALKGLKVGTTTYIDYSIGYLPDRLKAGEYSKKGYNYFALTRAYITVEKEVTPWLSFRITPDITPANLDTLSLRLKYGYALFKLPDFGFLTNIVSEVGQGHMPWLHFEEQINPYRMQGYMAREFVDTFNSADRGVSIGGYFGGKLDKNYVKKLSANYPLAEKYTGKYGSWWFSYLNGPGYTARELNINKGFQGRITIRPFGTHTEGSLPLAGLQFSYYFNIGKGGERMKDVTGDARFFRKASYPRYNVNLGMISYQHPWFVTTLQYSESYGNQRGRWVVSTNNATPGEKVLKTKQWSFFIDVTMPFHNKLHLIARYDWFDPNDNVRRFYDPATREWILGKDDTAKHYMVGLAYYLHKNNILMLNFEWMDYEKYYKLSNTKEFHKMGAYDPSGRYRLDDAFRIQTVLQINF
ncbi:MAG: hypothetical protein NZ530_07990 [Thermodesulfobacteriaceae bacterium]|nr:hypothetical protein [Thermodesulfobacteriaceae bacterium]